MKVWARNADMIEDPMLQTKTHSLKILSIKLAKHERAANMREGPTQLAIRTANFLHKLKVLKTWNAADHSTTAPKAKLFMQCLLQIKAHRARRREAI